MTTEQESAVETSIEDLLHGDDVRAAVEALAAMHPADQADLLQRLDEDDRETMLSLLSAEGLGDLLGHLDEDLLKEVVEPMPAPPSPASSTSPITTSPPTSSASCLRPRRRARSLV
jgi:Mg/Co/Ni transporter MgtE